MSNIDEVARAENITLRRLRRKAKVNAAFIANESCGAMVDLIKFVHANALALIERAEAEAVSSDGISKKEVLHILNHSSCNICKVVDKAVMARAAQLVEIKNYERE